MNFVDEGVSHRDQTPTHISHYVYSSKFKFGFRKMHDLPPDQSFSSGVGYEDVR